MRLSPQEVSLPELRNRLNTAPNARALKILAAVAMAAAAATAAIFVRCWLSGNTILRGCLDDLRLFRFEVQERIHRQR